LRSNFDSRTSENALDCKSIIRDYGLGFLTDNGILEECRKGDLDGHGTWVAGRIGAAANGFGSNGVAPKVTIRSYKVLAGEFGGLTSWIVGGMVDACHDGADIVNMSIEGFDDPSLESDAQDYLLWADAVRYCRARGATIVAAAGNEHVRIDRANLRVAGQRFIGAGRVTTGPKGIGIVYPGEALEPYWNDFRGMLLVPGGVPGVIAVSATANEVVGADEADPSVRWPDKWVGARDQLAYYSNYGSRIDLAAPGGARKFNIALFDGGLNDVMANGYGTFSAVDANSLYCTDPELSASYNSACFTIGGQGFAWSQGTSMSAPNVSGVAVLTLAVNPRLRHNPDALLARLKQTANRGVTNYTGPNDAENTTAAIDSTPCDTGFCHLDFEHPISFGEAYGAGIVDAEAAVS
jgi:subtilisin family serine protease